MFSSTQLAALTAPLDRSKVATRSQSGRSLSYVEAWHVIAELNRIFGPGNWDRETIDMVVVAERERKIGQAQKDGWSVSYRFKVRLTVRDPGGCIVIKEGNGNGHGIDVDPGLAHESACKEAESDGMKRAAMMFGNPFGLALYDKTQANVADTPPEWPDSVVAMVSGINASTDLAALTAWKAKNEPALSMLDDDAATYVVGAYRARRELFTPQKKAA